MYKRLGGGYLQGGEVNRRYDPADNELYIVVRRLTSLVDSMNKRLSFLESQVLEMKGNLATRERGTYQLTEISEPQIEQIQYPDSDKEEEDLGVIFGGSLEGSSDEESPLDLESQVLGVSEPKALSKRLSEGFWTSCSKLKNLIISTATFGSQETCPSGSESPLEPVPMLVLDPKVSANPES